MAYGDRDEEEEDKLPPGCFSSYLAEGEALLRLHKYEPALERFQLALQFDADNKNCLVYKARCLLAMGKPKEALREVQAALRQDGQMMRAMLCKADALYAMGSFEHALVYYHRGLRLRPEVREFNVGIQKSQEAIENCIGDHTKIKLVPVEEDINTTKKMAASSKMATADAATGGGGLAAPPGDGGTEEVQSRTSMASSESRGKRKTARAHKTQHHSKQMLEELYPDLVYLEALQTRQGVGSAAVKGGGVGPACSPTVDGSGAAGNAGVGGDAGTPGEEGSDGPAAASSDQRLASLVHHGLHYLDNLVEFWQQQKPLYARAPANKRLP